MARMLTVAIVYIIVMESTCVQNGESINTGIRHRMTIKPPYTAHPCRLLELVTGAANSAYPMHNAPLRCLAPEKPLGPKKEENNDNANRHRFALSAIHHQRQDYVENAQKQP